jgi:hypothetical protein
MIKVMIATAVLPTIIILEIIIAKICANLIWKYIKEDK